MGLREPRPFHTFSIFSEFNISFLPYLYDKFSERIGNNFKIIFVETFV